MSSTAVDNLITGQTLLTMRIRITAVGLLVVVACLQILPSPISKDKFVQHATSSRQEDSGVILRRLLQDRHRVLTRVNATQPQCPVLDDAPVPHLSLIHI